MTFVEITDIFEDMKKRCIQARSRDEVQKHVEDAKTALSKLQGGVHVIALIDWTIPEH